jgi:hypothetical protein
MDWEGKVRSATFACASTGRPLAPGEVFFSGLVQAGDGGFARTDWSAEAWDAVDKAPLLSWWRQRVPRPETDRRQVRLDKDLLRRLFTDLQHARERDRQCLCYVILLCLVRARAFALLEVDPEGPWLLVEDRADKVRLRVRDPRMGPEDEAAVLARLVDIVGVGEPLPAEPGPGA